MGTLVGQGRMGAKSQSWGKVSAEVEQLGILENTVSEVLGGWQVRGNELGAVALVMVGIYDGEGRRGCVGSVLGRHTRLRGGHC